MAKRAGEVLDKQMIAAGVVFEPMSVKSSSVVATSIGRVSFAPGRLLPCHVHNCDETITVLQGTAFSEVRGKRYKLMRDESFTVPDGVPHRSGNASHRRRLVILCNWNSAQVQRHDLRPEECTRRTSELVGRAQEVALHAADPSR